MRRWNRTTSLVLLAILALISACGGDDGGTAATDGADTTAGGSDADYPVTVTDDRDEEVTVGARPERIVSMSATATETLFAIGAGDQVVAVEANSNFPEEAPTTELSGFDPNVEAIAELDPDLVVIFFDPGDMTESLELLDIPVLMHDAVEDLDGAYAQIAQLGEVTGNIDGAAEVIADMRERIGAAVASVEDRQGLTYYHELDDTLFTATSNTFIGHVYGLFGLENVADAADDGSSYPQLSAEYLLEADPDLIFLADTKCCGQSAETLAERPGFGDLTAVREGRVIELDDDTASRWGPRIVEFVETVAAAVERVPAGAGA